MAMKVGAMKMCRMALVAAIAGRICIPAAHAEPLPESERLELNGFVDQEAPEISGAALKIWNWAEVGFHEWKSSELLQSLLRKDGFEIKAGVAGMPTAFVASFRTGPGPIIGITAEFDALAGISQQANSTTVAPVVGADAGHACGHNLLGAGAIKAWMITHHIKGEIRIYGSPAEESGGGKVFMVRDGLFKDVDIVLHWHPMDRNTFFNVTMMASQIIKFTFHGVSSHAAVSPERGRSALAAQELMDAATNALRQFVPDGVRIHSIITNGGKSANVVPNIAESTYFVRDANIDVTRAVAARVIKAARGAALATETTVDYKLVAGYYPVLVNNTLLNVLSDNAKPVIQGLRWSPEEIAYAKAIRASFGKADVPYNIHDIEKPDQHTQPNAGSTDVGDISYVVPTAGILVTSWVPGSSAHSWQSAGASGASTGTKGMVVASKILAASVAQLFENPELIKSAKAEFDAGRGPNFNYDSLAGDAKPDIGPQLALRRALEWGKKRWRSPTGLGKTTRTGRLQSSGDALATLKSMPG